MKSCQQVVPRRLLVPQCAAIALLCSSALAAESADLTEMANLVVQLGDEQGQPVKGALVRPYAMRVVGDSGHGYWDPHVLGPPRTVRSDAAGRATIQYPVRVKSGTRILRTRLVTFAIQHLNYVSKVVHFDLGATVAEVRLKSGCDVRVWANDAQGQPIHDFGVIVAGPFAPDIWITSEDGSRRSSAINNGTWQTMLVRLQDHGPTLFSDVLPLRVRPGQSLRMRNVPLLPGARIRGSISKDVPRPVSGYVIAVSVPSPANDTWNSENPSVTWHDWVDIDDQGNFELQSVPRGGELQLIAICDGWISTTTVRGAHFFVMGQLFAVEHQDVALTVDMERTGTVQIQLVTVDGAPFPEGRVTSLPSQRHWKGAATSLGHRSRSETIVRNQFLPYDRQIATPAVHPPVPYDQLVDRQGRVTLTGLPVARNLSFVLRHDRFKLLGADRVGRVRFKLDSPDPLHLKATVIPADGQSAASGRR